MIILHLSLIHIFHQRNQEGTGLAGHLDVGAHPLHHLCVDAAADRSFRADDADLSIFRGLGRRPGAGVNYADDGNIQLPLHRFQRIGCRGVACDNDRCV